MGQANQRGTFEERKAAAIARPSTEASDYEAKKLSRAAIRDWNNMVFIKKEGREAIRSENRWVKKLQELNS